MEEERPIEFYKHSRDYYKRDKPSGIDGYTHPSLDGGFNSGIMRLTEDVRDELEGIVIQGIENWPPHEYDTWELISVRANVALDDVKSLALKLAENNTYIIDSDFTWKLNVGEPVDLTSSAV